MDIIDNNLLPMSEIERALEVVPKWSIDNVKTLQIQVCPNKARRQEARIEEGDRYGLAHVLGRWHPDKKLINIYLWACWKYAEYRYASYEFGAWNQFLETLYHEFSHAEDWTLTDYGDDNYEQYQTQEGIRLWLVQDEAARVKRKNYWDTKDFSEKIEVYARRYASELHKKADLAKITIPQDIGVFNKFVNDTIKHGMSYVDGHGWTARSHLFFDKVRMHKYRLHHTIRDVNAILEKVGGAPPIGTTVLTRTGRKKTYYRHEELLALSYPKSPLEIRYMGAKKP